MNVLSVCYVCAMHVLCMCYACATYVLYNKRNMLIMYVTHDIVCYACMYVMHVCYACMYVMHVCYAFH